MKRLPLIVGNWKMHKTREESGLFVKRLLPLIASSQRRVFLVPPFTAIETVVKACAGTNILVGAQNMHEAESGAFTGEVSSKMLKEVGARFVLIGHSERRQLFFETDLSIHRKVKAALKEGLIPIVCVGESWEQRENGKVYEVLFSQLDQALQGLSKDDLKSVMIAYEPVWAIGTGKHATVDIAQEVHRKCREWIEKMWGTDVSQEVYILYGGSVKPENISELMQGTDIDGALVGGAALDPEMFAKLINF